MLCFRVCCLLVVFIVYCAMSLLIVLLPSTITYSLFVRFLELVFWFSWFRFLRWFVFCWLV